MFQHREEEKRIAQHNQAYVIVEENGVRTRYCRNLPDDEAIDRLTFDLGILEAMVRDRKRHDRPDYLSPDEVKYHNYAIQDQARTVEQIMDFARDSLKLS